MAAPGKGSASPNGQSSYGWPIVPGYSPQMWGGGAVLWVGNATGVPAGDGSTPGYPLSSLFGASGALAKIVSKSGATKGHGGSIYVLPGHVESIAASTSLTTIATATATGVNIIGLGNGSQRPLFNWTAAASALLVNQAGTWFRNMVFNLSSTAATVVTAAITVSAADCGFDNILFSPSTSATQQTTTAITVASGANNLVFNQCRVLSETYATNPTDILTTTAAVDSLQMYDCTFLTAVNATTNGVINLANAPTNVLIRRCTFDNKKAASTVFAIASASTTGSVEDSTGIIQTTGAATSFSTPGNLTLSFVWAGTIAKTSITIGNASS